MVTVVGQRGDGPVSKQRTVTLREFIAEWGPYARFLWHHARHQTVVIDGCKVRVIVR